MSVPEGAVGPVDAFLERPPLLKTVFTWYKTLPTPFLFFPSCGPGAVAVAVAGELMAAILLFASLGGVV